MSGQHSPPPEALPSSRRHYRLTLPDLPTAIPGKRERPEAVCPTAASGAGLRRFSSLACRAGAAKGNSEFDLDSNVNFGPTKPTLFSKALKPVSSSK